MAFLVTDESFTKLACTKNYCEMDHNFHYEIKGIITLKGKKKVVLILNDSFVQQKYIKHI